LIPELNNGQLVKIIRDKYFVDAIPYNKIQGQPFMSHEVVNKIKEIFSNISKDAVAIREDNVSTWSYDNVL
jgi:2-oxoglutarate ferredoxin oxidoreductase subunit alpha